MKVKIFIAKSAENSMQKYSSSLNLSVHLNGLVFSNNLVLFAFPKQYTGHSAEGTFIRQPTPTHNKNRDPYRCMLEWDTENTLLFKNKKKHEKGLFSKQLVHCNI